MSIPLTSPLDDLRRSLLSWMECKGLHSVEHFPLFQRPSWYLRLGFQSFFSLSCVGKGTLRSLPWAFWKEKADKSFVQLCFGSVFSSSIMDKTMIFEWLWKTFSYLSIAIASPLNSLRDSLLFSWACRGLLSVLHRPLLKRPSPWPWSSPWLCWPRRPIRSC